MGSIPSTTTAYANGASDDIADVCVVGAGPAGLMLGALMARLGHKTEVLDERPDQTTAGRADGIQPKTIETFQMLGLGDDLMRSGVKVHDICMWHASADQPLRREGRAVHYPASVVDVLQPYILLCHQGMVESLFVDDLRRSGTEVRRSRRFQSFTAPESSGPLRIASSAPADAGSDEQQSLLARFVVGCDGARSLVRQGIPDSYAEGTPHSSVWGVLDGELDTDFPDIWSKTVVRSDAHGSVLIIPRERNMTRLYIEMKESTSSRGLGEDFVKEQARRILAPHRVEWRSVEWFGNYQVAQRVAAKFADPSRRAFIAGDASHTHSPKAAQGMNTSMHDSWNLGWKLNLALRGLAGGVDGADGHVLLDTYEGERKKIAHDLIDFDLEHANEIAGGDAKSLAANFRKHTAFISGVGAEYGPNAINSLGPGASPETMAGARPGCNLPPSKATRYIDACPVDVQLDIPMLGQFRVYVFAPNVVGSGPASFLSSFSAGVAAPSSLVSRLSLAAAKSYEEKPRAKRPEDVYVRPERYTTVSQLFTFALITSTDKSDFEIGSLPPLLSQSAWTVYLDDAARLDTQGRACTEKWLGPLGAEEVAIVNVRPDGYVGSVGRWDTVAGSGAGEEAARWLDQYYGGFLSAPTK